MAMMDLREQQAMASDDGSTGVKRSERRMLVEFGPGILEEIRAMAVYKDQPPTVMVRGWIVERLRDEQRRMYRPGSEQ